MTKRAASAVRREEEEVQAVPDSPEAEAVAHAAPGGPRAAAAAPQGSKEAWRRFTPAEVVGSKCLARTWGGGRGGQCHRLPKGGQGMCEFHLKCDQWAKHGRVDGPIPEAKLQEFQRAAGSDHRTLGREPGGEDLLDLQQMKRPRHSPVAAAPAVATPPGLKKPVGGGYSVFFAANSADIKASLAIGSRITDMARRAGELWKAMSEEQKKPFVAQYVAKAAAYKAALELHKQGLAGVGHKALNVS